MTLVLRFLRLCNDVARSLLLYIIQSRKNLNKPEILVQSGGPYGYGSPEQEGGVRVREVVANGRLLQGLLPRQRKLHGLRQPTLRQR